MYRKRSKLVLAAAVLGAIFGCCVLWYISNIKGTPFSAPIIEFCTPLVILVFAGVIINLLGFVTRKNIIVVIATVIYGLSALCVGRFLMLFSLVDMWSQIGSFFIKYSLPIFPSIILCIMGLVLQKKNKDKI